jgi:hypothetical protein
VTATDPAGNDSAPKTVNTTVDTTPPAAPTVTSPADGSASNDPTPTVSGTAEKGSTVTVKDEDGNVLCTDVADPTTGEWACDVPADKALDDGDHTLSVMATDPAGNTSPATTVDTTTDTDKPDAPAVTSPANGSSIKDNTPTITGTGEAGAKVTVKDGNTVLCSDVLVGNDGKWTCTVPDDKKLSDAPHTLTATQTDPAGNVSDPTTVTTTVDTAPPAKPVIESPADGDAINDTTPKVSGTAEPGAKVTVTDEAGNPLCDATATSSGKWSCEVPADKALSEGVHDIKAVATDKAGNASEPAVAEVDVDTTPPDAPVIKHPVDGSSSNDTTPTIDGTAEPGSTVTVTDENGTELCQVQASSTGAWTCEVKDNNALADGPHEFTATATDPAGNVSDPAKVTSTTDTEKPGRPTVTSPKNGDAINDTTPTITGTGDPGNKVNVKDGNGNPLCTDVVVAANGSWTCTVPDSKALTDGPVSLNVTQTDPAGNVSDPVTVQVNVDTVPPAAPTVTKPANGSSTNDTTPTFEGTAEPGSTVSVKDGSTELCHATAGTDGKWTCTPAPDKALGQGEHNLTATATDKAGNESPSTPVKVTVDTDKPNPPVVTKPADGDATDDTTPTFEGTGEPGAKVEVKDGDELLCDTTVGADGKWTCTVPDNKALDDGEHDIEVTQTDPAGNTSDPTEVGLDVDTEPPLPPVVTSPKNGDQINDTTPKIEGTGEAGAKVEVKDGDTVLCVADVGADGKWACTVPDNTALTEGDHTLTATQTDPAGNVSDPTTVTTKVDTTPPAAPVVTKPANGSSTNDTTPTVEGTAEAGSKVTVKDSNGQTLCETTASSTGKFTCPIESANALPEGPNELVVTATDPAGNTSAPTKVAVTVDTTPPDAPKVTEPKDGASSSATPTIKGEDGDAGDKITVKDKDSGKTICETTVKADGTWECEVKPGDALTDGPHDLVVTETDLAGNVSDPTEIEGVRVNPVPPTTPTVDTSDDTKISGTSDTDTTIDVKDKDGNPICSNVAVGADGKWSCTPSTPLKPGDEITVTATDPDGETSSVTVRKLAVTVAKASLLPGEQQTATGQYFKPGESVTATMYSDPYQVGTATADANGTVTFTWTVPASTDPGQHTIELVGATSGPGRATFTVSQPQPNTGAPVDVRFAAAAGLSSLIGVGFILAGWRRRRDQDEVDARRAA